MIDSILEYNKAFVASGAYEEYRCGSRPVKKLAVLSCMDTRLTELLPKALGLKNGDAKIIKNAGGVITGPFDSSIRSILVAIYELGVNEIMVVHHTDCGAGKMTFKDFEPHMLERGITRQTLDTIKACGIDLETWLEGFHDTEASVRKTVASIKNHPLVPADVIVRGFIMDTPTGRLDEIE